MRTLKLSLVVSRCVILTGLLVTASELARSSTIWSGPTINFTHSTATGNLQDQITTGVKITRSTTGGGLYNSVTESSAISGSPGDTKWAVGSLANFNTLIYSACPLEAGNHPPGKVGTSYVVHLVNEDIYLSLKLTAWGGVGMTGDRNFSYIRSTLALTPPTPVVTITNPASGAVFINPANVNIAANATVTSGTVTNVQFFTNSVLLGSVLTPPFAIAANNLMAGSYALTAVAMAAGIAATSTVVNITVVSTPTVSITNPASGAVFAAPANVTIGADTMVSGDTVTNVYFFANGALLGSVPVAPFTLTTSVLEAGGYALTTVVTASGISATSAVVNVSVVNPVVIQLSDAIVKNGQFSFSYTVDAGLSYVVQNSTNFLDWTSLETNVFPGSSALFVNALNPGGANFYRVGRLPNP